MSRQRGDDGNGMMIAGCIVLGVGLLFLFNELGYLPDFDVIWPVFPIIVGIALIIGSFRRKRRPDA